MAASSDARRSLNPIRHLEHRADKIIAAVRRGHQVSDCIHSRTLWIESLCNAASILAPTTSRNLCSNEAILDSQRRRAMLSSVPVLILAGWSHVRVVTLGVNHDGYSQTSYPVRGAGDGHDSVDGASLRSAVIRCAVAQVVHFSLKSPVLKLASILPPEEVASVRLRSAHTAQRSSRI